MRIDNHEKVFSGPVDADAQPASADQVLARKPPQEQTNEEWLAEYDHYLGVYGFKSSGRPVSRAHNVSSVARSGPEPVNHNPDNGEGLYRYVGHRTTRKSSVVLEFQSLDGRTRCCCFMNVSLTSSRGNTYPAGDGGQFNPPKKGKFRQFWLHAVGTPPPSGWSRVHKSMRKFLGDLLFTGELTEEVSGKGESYLKLRNVWAVRQHEPDIERANSGRNC